jgi:hypothetical protein
MKNLTEAELIERIQKQQENKASSYEEITHPDYEVWGRARVWSHAQAACLLAGFHPISEQVFDRLIQKDSPLPLDTLSSYYPISQTDLIRIKNMNQVIINSRLLVKARKRCVVNPHRLLAFCDKYSDLICQIPQLLIEAVSLGPHPSLNLPDFFDCLDIQTTETKQQETELQEISIDDVLNFPLTRLKPEQLAKLVIRAFSAFLWKINPKLIHKEIIHNPCFKMIRKLLTILIDEKHKKETPTTEVITKIYNNEKIEEYYSDQTISEWIRTVNPKYTPQK